MQNPKKERRWKAAAVAAFLLLIFLPGLVLVPASRITHKPLDVPLGGFTPDTGKAVLSPGTWLRGEFQEKLSTLVGEKIKPRGLMVKTYNTINFMLFHKAEQIVGKGYDLFEPEYINAELTLNAVDDFSLAENAEKMRAFAEQLVTLQEKLKAYGKTLVFYVAPSKANLYRDHIPDKYTAMSPGHVKAVDCLRSELEKTDLNWLICADLAGEDGYPAFYPTGIHWARPFEQNCSVRLMEMIREATGTPYATFGLDFPEERETAFWRDDDVLNLANVFYRPRITYCEYTTYPMDGDGPRLRMLLQGDSFALGLWKDLLDNLPETEIYLVTNNYSITDRENQVTLLQGDWSKVDWNYYLDHTDVVAIEMAEPFLKHRTYGFTESLLAALDSYIPGTGAGAENEGI